MAGPHKTPPRFVPTLTDVVHMPGEGRPPTASQAVSLPPQAEALASPVPPPSPSLHGGVPRDFEEYVAHRVMQHVDAVLAQRLHEAIAQIVQEQTRLLVPHLLEEVESVVRHVVHEALGQELAGDHDAD